MHLQCAMSRSVPKEDIVPRGHDRRRLPETHRGVLQDEKMGQVSCGSRSESG